MTPIKLNGTVFRSLRECWLARTGHKPAYSVVAKRFASGQFTIDECFDVPPKLIPTTVDGRTYRSVSAACRAVGLKRYLFDHFRRTHEGEAGSFQTFVDTRRARSNAERN